MTHRFAGRAALPLGVLALAALGAAGRPLAAQDRLKSMPGYEQFTKMAPQYAGAVKSGSVLGAGGGFGGGGNAGGARTTPEWSADGKSLDYTFDGKRMRLDLASKKIAEAAPAAPAAPATTPQGGRGPNVERGRQATQAVSPDGKLKALYRDRNLFMANADGANESAITMDGSEAQRIKYGTASWVYGEELGQTTAMWWNPASTKVGYYRFDEKPVPDFYLQMDQTKIQSALDIEAYPKAGAPNPVADIFVYDVATKKSVRMDVRGGKPFTNDVVGHYVYNVRWSPDGSELLLNRTNRRQNVMEFIACQPDSGACRVVVREEWPTGWVENSPSITWLKDGKRFLWMSERTGFKNYYLYDISGKLLNAVTQLPVEVVAITRVDEDGKALWYTARDGDNFLKVQLHRVGLDGKGDVRLTDPKYTHTVNVSTDGKYILDVAQAHDVAPFSQVLDAKGKLVAELAKSDMTKFEQLGLKKVEMFTYLAADGKTELRGMISFPSNFDPSRKYPVIMPVYGGPASGGNTSKETWTMPSTTTEYGFIVVNLDSRAAPGMGKRTLDAIYQKLGQVEMDDMAEGLKALAKRPYIDGKRMGIHGTSYGGYTSAMMILRHPDLIAAASSSSPVTAWDHYDSIYTERYMWIPQENADGYKQGSAMSYADKLKGRLLLYYGTADNNVHPNNSMQLIKALQQAGKSFEVQVGPDAGHTAVNGQRMMEFFIENLVLKAGLAS